MRYLPRHLEEQILEAARYFKAILLLGARQVGKSTLFAHLFKEIKTIVFDPIQDIYRARRDPDLFLESFPAPLILDEVQYAPELLPALKRKMDQSEAKGQYFLTGSQNFNMLKTVSESMAGRVAIFNLENFTLLETLGRGKETSWLSSYLKEPKTFHLSRTHTPPTFPPLVETLFRGCFPGILELPLTHIGRYFNSYLQTYVERDIRLQENIRELLEFDHFLRICSALTAQEINTSQLGRELGLSPHTAKRWLEILILSYQWLELLPFHGHTIKRISGKKKGFFKDTGFACYLQGIDSAESLAIHPRLGAIFETFLVNSIHQQCSAMQTPPVCTHWRTHGGAEVDLILEKEGKFYPIEMKCKTHLTTRDLSGLEQFRKTYPHLEICQSLVIYAGKESFQLNETTTAIPWNLL